MVLDVRVLLCKYLLTFFNKILQAVGIVLLWLGVWLMVSESTSMIFKFKDPDSNSNPFVLGVRLLIGLGSLMVIVATIGDYGVYKKKRTGLLLLAILLVVLTVAELAVGVIVYSERKKTGEFLMKFYTYVIDQYEQKGDVHIVGTLIYIHTKLECCGVFKKNKTAKIMATCRNAEDQACTELISCVFGSETSTLLGILGTAAVLIAALVCTVILMKGIKRERERNSGCL